MYDADNIQETFKEEIKQLSAEATTLFNALYHEIIGICKIAANVYSDNQLLKEQFTFSKVISNVNTHPAKSTRIII